MRDLDAQWMILQAHLVPENLYFTHQTGILNTSHIINTYTSAAEITALTTITYLSTTKGYITNTSTTGGLITTCHNTTIPYTL